MKTMTTWAALWAFLATGIAGPAAAEGKNDPGLTELVQILRNEGVLDDAQYESIAAKASQKEEKKSWADRITLSGDMRGRYEGFFYQNDTTGESRTDQNRLRYRLRLKGVVDVNERMNAIFRLAAGSRDPRSTNTSLGSSIDFDSDPIQIDQAYLQLTPFPNGEIPGVEGWMGLEFGKMPNPFVWGAGPDHLLWDHDITPEGTQLRVRADLNDDLELFSNGAYYIIDENSESRDPQMVALQGGARYGLTDELDFGGRLTWYHFLKLDEEFFLRATHSDLSDNATGGGGNLGDAMAGGNNRLSVVETSGYITSTHFEDWPITAFWTYSNNVDAETSAGAGKNADAWMVGAEVGSKKKWIQLGLLYAEIEANAFPSMFIDSDLTDGRTNRKGWSVYATRQILENTDFRIETLVSDEIHSSIPPYEFSATDSDRVRVRADIEVKF